MIHRFHLTGLLALALTATVGCGVAVYRPAGQAGFELDPDYEINDEDVRKAFEASPQLELPAKVGYFSFDASRSDEVGEMLSKAEGVAEVYPLPAFLVTGQHRYERFNPWHRRSKAPSIKKMRLLAARAHCDLLVIMDYGHKIDLSPNWLTAFSILILPPLFLPYIDHEVDAYLDAYLIDVRNGYLYAHVTTEEHAEDDYHTIYSSWSRDKVDEFWGTLLGQVKDAAVKAMKDAAVGVKGARPAAPAATSKEPVAEPAAPAAPPAPVAPAQETGK